MKMNEEIIHFMNNIDFENTGEVYNIIYKLEHNWNELKSWLEEGKKISAEHDNSIGYNFIGIVLDKIKELEEGGNNE